MITLCFTYIWTYAQEANNEPVALKTKLGWVTFGGRQNNNKYPNINVFSNEFDLGNMVSKFWQIE